MTWSILEGDKRIKEKVGGAFHVFTAEEWKSYSFAEAQRIEWFRNLKFGLFIHFGISACGKVDIGWSRELHKLPDPGVGYIPTEIYDGWVNEFSIERFDAEAWVQLAEAAGMKYIVVITKHHDGYHLWDTDYCEYKVTNYKAQRDYIGELIAACHKKEMPIGLYYSQRDWHHPDYEPVKEDEVEVINTAPFYRYKPGKQLNISEKHQAYIKYMHDAVEELMTKYGKIDFLWWDSAWCNGMYPQEMWDTSTIEEKVRQLQPGILINNRGGLPGDYDTPEQQIGMFQQERAWESCMCVSKAWAWTDEPAKPLKTLVRQLIQCVVGDGNLLLSMGGKSDGTIPTPEAERLIEIGQWLKEYGESIYGTRGGPYLPGKWGGSTHKKNIVYLHLLEEQNKISVPLLSNRLKEAQSLTGEEIEVSELKDRLMIQVKQKATDNIDIIIKLVFENEITEEFIPQEALEQGDSEQIFESTTERDAMIYFGG